MKSCLVISWLALLAQEPRWCQGAPLTKHQGDVLGAALASSVALLNEGGAQRNFDLFYPKLPADNVKKEETSTSVPVIHLPFENEEDFEKVAADAILDMIPHELLENNKKVRPVDVKIIEHDGYIDYEIEFVELSDDYDYIYDYHEEDSDNESVEATTEVVSTSTDITFVDLLKKARNKHRQRLTDATEEINSSNLNTFEKDEERSQKSRTRQRKPASDSGNKSPITSNLRSNAIVRNSDNLELSSSHLGRSSTTPAYVQLQTDISATTEESSTASPQTTTTTTDLVQQQLNYNSNNNNNDFPELPRSSQQEQNIVESDHDESSDKLFDDGYSEEYFLTSESKPELSVFTDNSRQSERVPKVIRNKNDKSQQLEEEPVESKTPSTEEILGGHYHEVDPGQYHEVNPGQYHEINPGQYHEVNPGQYHEVNPGQYHEVNPGQYKLNEEDIKVSVDENRDRGSKTYDVAANVGDFIIGEVGRIDINSGQTLEGVRYTALESEVDYEKIKEILEMYFGARTS